MDERNETMGLAAWEHGYAAAEAEYEAAQEENSAHKGRRPFFHWGMALFFLVFFLGLPAWSYFSFRERWTAGDWVFNALLWAMGVLNMGLSISLALRDYGVSRELRPMRVFCARLESLRRRIDAEEETPAPGLARFFDDCEEAHLTWLNGLLLFREEYRSLPELLPLFALLLAAGLVPLVLAGLSGAWDLINWIQNLLMMAAACVLTGLNLCLELIHRRDTKDYQVTEAYLAALGRAHDLYLRRAESSAPRQE